MWVIYSVFDGLFQALAVLLGARCYAAGGIIDFLAYNLPAGISKTRYPIFILVGIIEIIVFYFLFTFLIKKMNLKTPGREDNTEEVKLHTKADYKAKADKYTKNDYNLASTIVDALGGKNNIETVNNCFSRLRVDVKNVDIIDEESLKGTGASGVIKNGNNIQVIYGPKVSNIRNKVDKYLNNYNC